MADNKDINKLNNDNIEFTSPSVEGLNIGTDINVNDNNEVQKLMDLENKRLIETKQAGIAMGLSGQELINYIVNSNKEVLVREELSEDFGKPKKVKIEYSEPKSETYKKSENEIRQEVMREIEENAKKHEEKTHKTIEEVTADLEKIIKKLSEKQTDAPYDYVKLPSLGKLYKNVDVKNGMIKVAYINGSDEDVLTNPGILSSGRFLEVLFERKLIEENLSYKDLLPVDRDAIMLWLRSTAYGSEYPVNLTDNEGNEFVAEIELDKLPINYLEKEPNKNGYFEYVTNSGDLIEYSLLTVGDIEKLEKIIEKKAIDLKGLYTSSGSDEVLLLMVKSFNGITNKSEFESKIKYMRMSDILDFKNEISSHDFGVDLNLKITTPKNEIIETPFPFEPHFFWPNI